jgi:RNA polymerase-binding transcription factor DksA
MTSPPATSRADLDHLTPEATALLRALLLCELADQTSRATQYRQPSRQSPPLTEEDAALARDDTTTSAARAEFADRAMTEIRDALCRLDDGSYGTCDACGVPIPFDRLEVIPHARRCVACELDGPRLFR